MAATSLIEVVFLSQKWAEAYQPRPNEAIVSITDRGAQDADLNAGWLAVLRIKFDDVDPVETPLEAGEDLLQMQVLQADRIAAFVRKNLTSVATLVVHCKYGQSRSAGVAKAVAEFYGLPFPEEYEYANDHVYRLVLASLRRQAVA